MAFSKGILLWARRSCDSTGPVYARYPLAASLKSVVINHGAITEGKNFSDKLNQKHGGLAPGVSDRDADGIDQALACMEAALTNLW